MSRVVTRFTGLVQELHALKVVGDLDLYLVDSMVRRHGPGSENQGETPGVCGHGLPEPVPLALVLASRAIRDSHVCLDLDALKPGNPEPWPAAEEWKGLTTASRKAFEECGRTLADPDGRARVFEPFPALVGSPDPDSAAPYVRDGSRLYLRRYWDYERLAGRKLLDLARAEGGAVPADSEIDGAIAAPLKEEQKKAAWKALHRRLCVISGGPGTGKTFTAARILACLAMQPRSGRPPLRIRIAAPTGKAAGRVQESLEDALRDLPEQARQALAEVEPACTLERLLGYRHGSPYFRHDAENPLPADVVLVDEASMIDLPKMAKLLDALAPGARLILLGDMHQLASVQPGSVLGEICQAAALADSVVELKQSNRFGSETPIGRLSAAVNAAHTEEQAEKAWNLLADAPEDGVELGHHATPDALTDGHGWIDPDFARAVLAGFREFLAARETKEAFEALAKFRVLCVLRHGPLGVVTVNRLIEKVLALDSVDRTSIAADLVPRIPLKPTGGFYDHRVLMVLRNDYGMGLFNGDIGIVRPDPRDAGRWAVFFERHGAAGSGEERYRRISPRLLPEHETAFAMTVHKSQGSEFERVLLLLPNQESRVLTRETVYTGLTRVRRRMDAWADAAVFKGAIRRTVRRFSGLGASLAGGHTAAG